MDKGFLSFESLLAFLLLIVVVLAIPPNSNFHASSLYESQKASDLLIVWARYGSSLDQMNADAFLFLEEGYLISVQKDAPSYSDCCASVYWILRNNNGGTEKVWLVLFQNQFT